MNKGDNIMKNIKYITTTLFVFILIGVNVSVVFEAENKITITNEAQANRYQCYEFDWDWVDAGTGFGCKSSSGMCSIISNESDCTHYSFSGSPEIIITPGEI